MAGFRIRRRFSVSRFNIEGRGLRAGLTRKPRVKTRVMQSPKASLVAEIKALNWMLSEANKLAEKWIDDHLVEIENDPSMRDAFEMIDPQNHNMRNTLLGSELDLLQDGGAALTAVSCVNAGFTLEDDAAEEDGLMIVKCPKNNATIQTLERTESIRPTRYSHFHACHVA
ncbi:uncharacterized protein LOC120206942 [Hibiscus syriacus]|uniref:uncharacterized protein LOC120206942 n=1 Tax=Hibiscus syriacus TaxID=106335 RepID=UPI0019247A9F|nr:uncharacterized protein LOC120206942 [Hibiscus syriacus]